jgi:hypothetical protein
MYRICSLMLLRSQDIAYFNIRGLRLFVKHRGLEAWGLERKSWFGRDFEDLLFPEPQVSALVASSVSCSDFQST